MNRNYLLDYISFILLKLLGPLLRKLPLTFILFIGRRVGEIFYFLDFKHRAIAHSNLRVVFGKTCSPSEINKITRSFYRAFGQNLLEIFIIPLIDKKYINKYVDIEGLNYIYEGLKKGKGIILLGVHAGSWELSNIICANLGIDFSMFVREQRFPRLNSLLNYYRQLKGCKVIQRKNQIRQLVEILNNNQAIGMTVDQGGKSGCLVKFFGKVASMPYGGVRLALEYGCTLLPVFHRRIKGPYSKITIEPPFLIKKTGDLEKDIRENLQNIISIFEKYIFKYPKEYLWTYKIWKYTKEKNILILDDGKAGHLNQSEAIAQMLDNHLQGKSFNTNIEHIEVRFKNKFCRQALTFSTCLSGKYQCQGCLWCLKSFLKRDTYKSLVSKKADIVISCGSSLAPINFVVSRENLAKSITVMRPSILSTRRFDLIIMPRHDRPPKRRNVLVTEGALSLIDEEDLKLKIPEYRQKIKPDKDLVLGLLLGGDTKRFKLTPELLRPLFSKVKSFLEKHDGQMLITTSRRTSREVEDLVRDEFLRYPRCKFLVIANENNLPYAVKAILALSQFVIISPESISMISEAVNSKKYVAVFNASRLDKKHRRFLGYFAKKRYLYFVEPDEINELLQDLYLNKPKVVGLNDRLLVKEALLKLL